MENVLVVIPYSGKKDHILRTASAVRNQLKANDALIIVNDSIEKFNLPIAVEVIDLSDTCGSDPAKNNMVMSRNIGALHNDSKYIIFLDEDCVPVDGWLETYRKQLKRRPLICGEIKWLDAKQKISNDYRAKTLSYSSSPLQLNSIAEESQGGGGNFGITRELFLKIGGFDQRFNGNFGHEDIDLFRRVLQEGVDIYYSFDAAVVHYYHPRSTKGQDKNTKLLHSIWGETYETYVTPEVRKKRRFFTKKQPEVVETSTFPKIEDLVKYKPKSRKAEVNKKVTVLIKTFERRDCIERLIDSIKKYYPRLKIMVIDDSEEPLNIKRCDYHYIGFDKGLSYGRNYGVKRIKTPYLLLLDDDFIFTEDTKLEILLDFIQEGLDVIAGSCGTSNWVCNFKRDGDLLITEPVHYNKSDLYIEADAIPNFFLAKVRSLKKVPWDNDLKMGEHSDWVLRAKDKLRTAYTLLVRIEHKHGKYDRHATFRGRASSEYVYVWMKKHSIRKYITASGHIYETEPKTVPINKNRAKWREKAVKNIKELQTMFPKCFAIYGTALGSLREQDIIGHDTDTDLGFLIEDFDFDEFFEKMAQAGYKIYREFGQRTYGCELVTGKNGVKTDFWLFYKFRDTRFNCLWDDGREICHQIPERLFKVQEGKLGPYTIRTLGQEYVEAVYGKDWRIPKVEFSWRTDHLCRVE